MTKDELRQKANDLPLAPGVYLMMDKTGKVIYVGKAKKLKNRVSQYFQDTASHNEKTRAMVSQVDHFDTIFVSTEFEALILENSLIKRHMPRYNILLKDDKGYPFVRLDADAAYPRFSLVGKTADDGAKYFGPFGGRRETRLAIEAVCGALHLPTCARQFPRDIGRERPCLNHHIGRCDGFCRPEGPGQAEYQARIRQAVRIFSGHYRQLTAELQQETDCHITFIDLSGGVGIPYRPDEPANDIAVIGEGVRRAYEEILVPAGMGDVALYTELGRFMLAPYGHLVTRAIHAKHIYKEYIGTDACACDLMRPAMYGSYHHITVMGKEDAPCDHKYDIVGGLCENNDKFAVDRMLPGIDIGDLLVIHDAGAHGLAMGYNYNGKLRCAEVLLQPDGSTRLIRRAETPEDYFATMVWDD